MKHVKNDNLNHLEKNFSRTNEFINYKSNNMGEDVMNSTIKKQENRVKEINNLTNAK